MSRKRTPKPVLTATTLSAAAQYAHRRDLDRTCSDAELRRLVQHADSACVRDAAADLLQRREGAAVATHKTQTKKCPDCDLPRKICRETGGCATTKPAGAVAAYKAKIAAERAAERDAVVTVIARNYLSDNESPDYGACIKAALEAAYDAGRKAGSR